MPALMNSGLSSSAVISNSMALGHQQQNQTLSYAWMAELPLISSPGDDDRNRLVAAIAITTGLALCVVIPRVLVRTHIARAFGWDDALMVLTIVMSVVGFSLVVVQTNHGAGRHRGDVDPDAYIYGMKINFINQPIYLFAICFVKLAIGAALVRIAAKGSVYRRVIYSVMSFMLVYTIACFFTIIFQCSDVRHNWNPSVPAKCFNLTTLQALSYTNAAFNILTDLIFSLFIPIPMLWNLNMNKRKKISLFCVLGLGVFSCAAACVKLSYLVNYGKKGDFLWDSRNISIWTAAELNVGIIAGSLPSLKPLFRRALGSTYARGSHDSGSVGAEKHTRLSNGWHNASANPRMQTSLDTSGDSSSEAALELSAAKTDWLVQSKARTNTSIEPGCRGGTARSEHRSETSEINEEHGITRTIHTVVEYS